MRKNLILSCFKKLQLTCWKDDGAIDKREKVRAGGSFSRKSHNAFGFVHMEFDLVFEILRRALGMNREIATCVCASSAK